ncbi:MAG: TlpA disulfide reductase family protein [Planctomycetota bacterium]
MLKPMSMIVCLLSAALLMGCDEEEVVETGPEPAMEITVLDAEGITKLRKQVAADGKVLVIDCWATWCSSCVEMFPHLHKAIKERGEDVVLASLSYDEGEASAVKAGEFLTEQDAWDNSYIATGGSDARDAIAEALSETWDGGALPAVFVYAPDGSVALEFTETRGDVQDWVNEITSAVDASLSE